MEDEITYDAHGPLDAYDMDLPFLAANAAFEIDFFISSMFEHAAKIDGSACKSLSRCLQESIKTGGLKPHPIVNFGTQFVFDEALAETFHGKSNSKGQTERILSIAKDLASISKDTNTHLLKETKKFCIALANQALTYQDSFIEAQEHLPEKQ